MKSRIQDLARKGLRLNINVDEVRSFDSELSKFIVKKPIEAIKIFEDNLNSIIKNL
jgi:DNA replicative helicase MCM subunit Mcm2 (Cdc46/Mcm family)